MMRKSHVLCELNECIIIDANPFLCIPNGIPAVNGMLFDFLKFGIR